MSACSGSMVPDTNVGSKIAAISEVSDDQKATFFFAWVCNSPIFNGVQK